MRSSGCGRELESLQEEREGIWRVKGRGLRDQTISAGEAGVRVNDSVGDGCGMNKTVRGNSQSSAWGRWWYQSLLGGGGKAWQYGRGSWTNFALARGRK